MLASAIGKDKEIKGMQIRKQEIILSIFTDDVIIYMVFTKENQNQTDKFKKPSKLLELISESSNVIGYKINISKKLDFYMLVIKMWA